jgi:hypothetical protein
VQGQAAGHAEIFREIGGTLAGEARDEPRTHLPAGCREITNVLQPVGERAWGLKLCVICRVAGLEFDDVNARTRSE